MLGLVFDPQKKCLGLEEVNKPVCGDDDIILKAKSMRYLRRRPPSVHRRLCLSESNRQVCSRP